MDPITVATLLGTCTAVAGRVATAVLALNGLISKFSKADRNISRLGAQLNLFHATVEQLRQWLQKATVLSDTLKHTIQQSLHACDDVIADIDEHVWKIQPKPGEEGVRFYNRIRHIWDEATILEQERRLTTQFQALDLFIRVLQLNAASDQDSVLESIASKDVLERGAEDARTIRISRHTGSGYVPSTIDGGANIDAELSVDEIIVNSGPYLTQYRKLVRNEFKTQTSALDNIQEGEQLGSSNTTILPNAKTQTTPVVNHRPLPKTIGSLTSSRRSKQEVAQADAEVNVNIDRVSWTGQFENKKWMAAYIICRMFILATLLWELVWTVTDIQNFIDYSPGGLNYFLFVTVWCSSVLVLRAAFWRPNRPLRWKGLTYAEIFGFLNISICAIMTAAATGESNKCGLVDGTPITPWMDSVYQRDGSSLVYFHCAFVDMISFWMLLFYYAVWVYIKMYRTNLLPSGGSTFAKLRYVIFW